ncbi:MAG: hypothetical protein M3214_06970 [Actinomycetota bacterium]|nr:hypothetical protein [Actinomycetota bacterium]
MKTAKQRNNPGARIAVTVALVALLAVATILVVTQIDKWSCGPPDSVWAESPDRCLDLP